MERNTIDYRTRRMPALHDVTQLALAKAAHLEDIIEFTEEQLGLQPLDKPKHPED